MAQAIFQRAEWKWRKRRRQRRRSSDSRPRMPLLPSRWTRSVSGSPLLSLILLVVTEHHLRVTAVEAFHLPVHPLPCLCPVGTVGNDVAVVGGKSSSADAWMARCNTQASTATVSSATDGCGARTKRSSSSTSRNSRRDFLNTIVDDGKLTLVTGATAARCWICWTIRPAMSAAASSSSDREDKAVAKKTGNRNELSSGRGAAFRTRAYGREEYTNSITASRDTNVSPREAYDVLRQRVPPARTFSSGSGGNGSQQQQVPKALDVGAGAGVSTAVLFEELGYQRIDAVDWSGDAWTDNVIEPVPDGVRFYEVDDDRFFCDCEEPQEGELARPACRYNVIVYNFAINAEKAIRVARRHLVEEDDNNGENNVGGLLLAPVNDRDDYWYKQSYLIVNSRGDVVWKSPPEVGAWSVQFQPDVTSLTCTGIWCGGMNGYQNNKRK